jgi:diguanylate cyclase (GGDEF)-like protein
MTIRLLLADSDPGFIERLTSILTVSTVTTCKIVSRTSAAETSAALKTKSFDVALLSYDIVTDDRFELFDFYGPTANRTAIIVLSDYPRKDWAFAALQKGAVDFIVKNRIDSFDLLKAIAYAMFRKCKEFELRISALRDPLTGIGNRNLFDEQAQTLLNQAKRGQERAAVLFMDVDGLKAINDTHGHALGDRLLNQVATRIVGQMRESDVVARIGGDEFVALLMHVNASNSISMIERKLNRAVVQTPYQINGIDIRIDISCGSAIYPDDSREISDLLQIADKRMYEKKTRKKARPPHHPVLYWSKS